MMCVNSHELHDAHRSMTDLAGGIGGGTYNWQVHIELGMKRIVGLRLSLLMCRFDACTGTLPTRRVRMPFSFNIIFHVNKTSLNIAFFFIVP